MSGTHLYSGDVISALRNSVKKMLLLLFLHHLQVKHLFSGFVPSHKRFSPDLNQRLPFNFGISNLRPDPSLPRSVAV